MKKIRIISLAIAAVMLLLSLSSCTNKVTRTGNGFVNKKDKITYDVVMVPLVPKKVSETPYATWKMHKDAKIDFYAIDGLDPKTWLYSEIEGLVCSEKINFPDLKAFAPDKCYVCYNGDITISFVEITDAEKVAAIVDAYVNGADATEPVAGGFNTYTVMFESPAYDEFYYKIQLRVYEEHSYLFQRGVKTVLADGLFGDDVPAYYEQED